MKRKVVVLNSPSCYASAESNQKPECRDCTWLFDCIERKEKKKTTEQMFEEFYKKPFNTITEKDLGPNEEIDWGEDVGDEIIK